MIDHGKVCLSLYPAEPPPHTMMSTSSGMVMVPYVCFEKIDTILDASASKLVSLLEFNVLYTTS
jgi:hypothetical protein